MQAVEALAHGIGLVQRGLGLRRGVRDVGLRRLDGRAGLARFVFRVGRVRLGLRNVLLRLRDVALSRVQFPVRVIDGRLVRRDLLVRVADGRRVVGDVLLRLRQVGLRRSQFPVRVAYRRRIAGDILLGLGQFPVRVVDGGLVVPQILVEPVQVGLGHRAGDRDRRAHTPIRLVARMIDRTQSEPVGAILQSGDDAMPVTRHAIPVFPVPVGVADADLHVVEVRFHAAAGIVPAVPLHVHHTQFRGEYRLGRDARRRHVRRHQSHDHRTPFAQPVGIRGNRAHAELIALPAFQPADADRQPLRVRHPAGNPRRTSNILTVLHAIRADVDGRIIRRLRDRSPPQGSQTQRGATRTDIGVRLHHKTSRSLRRAMILLRSGATALGTSEGRAAGDAGDLLGGPHLRVVYLVVERDAGLEPVGVKRNGDLLDSHLLAVLDGGRGDPVAGPVVHQRQAFRVGDEQRPRVLAAHPRAAGEGGLHERLGGGLVAHAALRDIGFPTAPRGRGRWIRLSEYEPVVALHEDVAGEVFDAFLFGCLEYVVRHADMHAARQVAAQIRAVGVPDSEGAALGTPVDRAAANHARKHAVQARSETVVERVHALPVVVGCVLAGVEAGGEHEAGSLACFVLVENRSDDGAGVLRQKSSFALVVPILDEMRGVVVQDLVGQPAHALAGERHRIAHVLRVAGAADEQIPAVVGFAPCSAVADFESDFEPLFEAAFQDSAADGATAVGDFERSEVVVDDARVP